MQERHPNACVISSQAENHHAMFLFVRCRSNLNKEMRTPTTRIVVNKADGLCGGSRTRKRHERCIAMPLVVMPPGEATACETPCSHKAGLSISNGRATTHHGLSGSGPRAHTYQQQSFHKHRSTRLCNSCAIRTAKATHAHTQAKPVLCASVFGFRSVRHVSACQSANTSTVIRK